MLLIRTCCWTSVSYFKLFWGHSPTITILRCLVNFEHAEKYWPTIRTNHIKSQQFMPDLTPKLTQPSYHRVPSVKIIWYLWLSNNTYTVKLRYYEDRYHKHSAYLGEFLKSRNFLFLVAYSIQPIHKYLVVASTTFISSSQYVPMAHRDNEVLLFKKW